MLWMLSLTWWWCCALATTPLTHHHHHHHNATFSILLVFTLDEDWLSSPTARLGLTHGVRSISTYALLHGHDLLSIYMPPPDGAHWNWNRVLASRARFERLGPLCTSYWLVWMESDQFITNYTVNLADIVAQAHARHGSVPTVITTRDAFNNVNTGVFFIRCGAPAIAILDAWLHLKSAAADDRRVRTWDHNGAFMVVVDSGVFADHIAFLPPKVFNAYPMTGADGHSVVACDSVSAAACARGWWSPGDFLVHFAGAKRSMAPFLEAWPRESWVGAVDAVAAG